MKFCMMKKEYCLDFVRICLVKCTVVKVLLSMNSQVLQYEFRATKNAGDLSGSYFSFNQSCHFCVLHILDLFFETVLIYML